MPATRRGTPIQTNTYGRQGPRRSPAVANPSRVMKRRTMNAAMAGVNITHARRAVDFGVSDVNRTPQARATPSALQASPNASARKVRTARQLTGEDVRMREPFRLSVTPDTATRKWRSLLRSDSYSRRAEDKAVLIISSTVRNHAACRLSSD